jgi:D-alanyl-D-alanine carboxypeptidase
MAYLTIKHKLLCFVEGLIVKKRKRIIGCIIFVLIILLIAAIAVFAGYPFTGDGKNIGQLDADDTAWCLILVNKWNYVPDDYKVELTELANGQSVDKRIYPALQEMFDTARSNNVYPIVASGYRTAKKQQSLMDEKIAEYRAEGCSAKEAAAKAEEWVSVPGASEHQLGIAVDINADGINSAGHEVYEWLNKNAHKFGFICRYPPDKTEITGVVNEPWHYRYVGVDAASAMHNQSICLEEYLNKIN